MYVCMHLSFDYAIDLWVFRENALVMLHFIITTHMCMELWRNILNMCIHTTGGPRLVRQSVLKNFRTM